MGRGGGETGWVGKALTCPQTCSRSLTPARCRRCCLHSLAWALEEVTAWGGGRGRGQGAGGGALGQRPGAGGQWCGRVRVTQSHVAEPSRSRGHSLSHCPTRPTQPWHTATQCHTQSYAPSHGEAQHRVTHCASPNVFLVVIYSHTIHSHTQRAEVSPTG